MTRQKVKMSFIQNEIARRSTFKKRKGGIFKKAHELATLCGIPICVLVKSAYDSNMEVWPTIEGANGILSQYNKLPLMERTQKMVNQETYLRQRISKTTESLKKLREVNRDLEMQEVMFGCMSGRFSAAHINKNDLPDLGSVIDKYLMEVNSAMKILKKNDAPPSSSSVAGAGAGARAVTTANFMPMPVVETHSGDGAGASSDVGAGATANHVDVKQIHKDLDLNKKQW